MIIGVYKTTHPVICGVRGTVTKVDVFWTIVRFVCLAFGLLLKHGLKTGTEVLAREMHHMDASAHNLATFDFDLSLVRKAVALPAEPEKLTVVLDDDYYSGTLHEVVQQMRDKHPEMAQALLATLES